MKLIVGLGNPGAKYAATRHNLGFMVVDALAEILAVSWTEFSTTSYLAKGATGQTEFLLLKPQTFMNESGKSVQAVSHFYKIPAVDVWVIHDDLDLTFGRIKLDENCSSAGHNGVESIIESLGTQNFKRFRIGVGRPTNQKPADVFVLEPFTADEISKVPTIINDASAAALVALRLKFTVSQKSN